MRLVCHGAARGVTGSCHLLEAGGRRVLVDCGLFQGGDGIEEANRRPFGFDPATVDALLLTHAHLDHCGRLPLLVREGFRGEVIATAATRDLARLVLLDAAHLQEAEAAWRARKAARRGRRPPPGPLYGLLDVLEAMDRFGRIARYGEPLEVLPGLRATFHDAGHILGSAFLVLEHGGRRVAFSGDLGSPGHPVLRDPEPAPAVDAVVMESTYGDRRHRPLADSVAELVEVVDRTLRGGGNVVVPSFALERAQELLYFLREAVEDGRLPAAMPVFLDSPMAIAATEVFRRHPECYDREARALLEAGRDPFRLPGLRATRETADSMAINQIRGGAVIIAGSGMCTGGRVLHHLRHNLWRRECAVVLVGFAAEGTLARRLVDGARRVRILGEDIPVRASIHTINGFSAHADRAELAAWHAGARARRTVLVHGETRAMEALAARLGGGVVCPREGEPVPLALADPAAGLRADGGRPGCR
ncbi:MBL fold metallo-hydrolase RNA specificity domain-containing protein [Inmirania thermothiophila]|uniref:Metallo-beta-lactamase family protein n=1 Tax=Inmirania thermothiophila TaxID=1750597 RepID=A0A3N1Y3B4_9GAMM|nr:MBL fold metallo-hydrolase [Inmirania thermothiophila]ROR32062.1 metallo-beta-lactamase family protein [Inmirania thermothiophila]